MKLPILLSVPHAGWKIPPEVQDICILSKKRNSLDSTRIFQSSFFKQCAEVRRATPSPKGLGDTIVGMKRMRIAI